MRASPPTPCRDAQLATQRVSGTFLFPEATPPTQDRFSSYQPVRSGPTCFPGPRSAVAHSPMVSSSQSPQDVGPNCAKTHGCVLSQRFVGSRPKCVEHLPLLEQSALDLCFGGARAVKVTAKHQQNLGIPFCPLGRISRLLWLKNSFFFLKSHFLSSSSRFSGGACDEEHVVSPHSTARLWFAHNRTSSSTKVATSWFQSDRGALHVTQARSTAHCPDRWQRWDSFMARRSTDSESRILKSPAVFPLPTACSRPHPVQSVQQSCTRAHFPACAFSGGKSTHSSSCTGAYKWALPASTSITFLLRPLLLFLDAHVMTIFTNSKSGVAVKSASLSLTRLRERKSFATSLPR